VNKSQTLLSLSQIYERAGYEVESMRLHRGPLLIGWFHTACLLHPDRPYKTTTGESCRYDAGITWGLTKLRLCRTVDDIYDPQGEPT
jgi:hypothetical protein